MIDLSALTMPGAIVPSRAPVASAMTSDFAIAFAELAGQATVQVPSVPVPSVAVAPAIVPPDTARIEVLEVTPQPDAIPPASISPVLALRQHPAATGKALPLPPGRPVAQSAIDLSVEAASADVDAADRATPRVADDAVSAPAMPVAPVVPDVVPVVAVETVPTDAPALEDRAPVLPTPVVADAPVAQPVDRPVPTTETRDEIDKESVPSPAPAEAVVIRPAMLAVETPAAVPMTPAVVPAEPLSSPAVAELKPSRGRAAPVSMERVSVRLPADVEIAATTAPTTAVAPASVPETDAPVDRPVVEARRMKPQTPRADASAIEVEVGVSEVSTPVVRGRSPVAAPVVQPIVTECVLSPGKTPLPSADPLPSIEPLARAPQPVAIEQVAAAVRQVVRDREVAPRSMAVSAALPEVVVAANTSIDTPDAAMALPATPAPVEIPVQPVEAPVAARPVTATPAVANAVEQPEAEGDAPVAARPVATAPVIDRPIPTARPTAEPIDRSVSASPAVLPEGRQVAPSAEPVMRQPVVTAVAPAAAVTVTAPRTDAPSPRTEPTVSTPRPAAEARSTTPATTAPIAHAPTPQAPAVAVVAAPIMRASVDAPVTERMPATPRLRAASPIAAAPVSQPAAQAFAAAMFATVRPQATRATDDPTAELVAAFPLAGLTLAPSAPVAVAAPQGLQSPPLDLTRDDWMGGMIERIETLRDSADTGVRETRMRLAPDAMGKVDVTIVQEADGQITVRIQADTPAARAIIAEAQPKLADMAEARGLKLSGSDERGTGTGFASQQQAQHQQQHPSQRGAAIPNRPASALSADNDAEPDTTDIRIA